MMEKKAISVLIEYCKNVVLGKVSVEHFPAINEDVLPRKYSEYALREKNPFSRPLRLEKEFSKFDVS